MTQMILDMRSAFATPVKRAPAAALRHIAGFAITGSGAAVLIAQAMHGLAAAAGV